ncbi:20811_t:CDS:1, partial [Gigaspora margarita]
LTSINERVFASGQAYVAISKATSWDTLDILSFDFSSIKTDHTIATKYARLAE